MISVEKDQCKTGHGGWYSSSTMLRKRETKKEYNEIVCWVHT